MSTWSLRYDDASPSPVTQTLAAWGISNAVLSLRSFEASTLTFDVAGDLDAAALFAYGESVTLLQDSTVRFKGKIRQVPRRGNGHTEAMSYTAEDVLGDLDRRFYFQPWQAFTVGGGSVGSVDAPAAVLFSLNLGATLLDIVDAAATAGIAIQSGTATGMSITPRKQDAASVTYLGALKAAARYVPDVCTVVDYTTTPPTLNFVRRGNATSVNVPVLDGVDNFNAQPLHDQKLNGVFITYRILHTIDDQQWTEIVGDVYPEGTTLNDENILAADVNLTGRAESRHITAQALTSRVIDAESFTWWERHLPWLADRNEAATLADGETSSESLTRELLTGAVPAWTGSGGQVTVKALFNGVVNGNIYVNKVLEVSVAATDLASGTYYQTTTSGSTPAETVPSGIAEHLYSALSTLHWQGNLSQVLSELTFDVKPGHVVNFTGTDISALTTAAAQVQEVTLDIDAGERSLSFGPPGFVSFSDLLELSRLINSITQGDRSAEQTSGTPTAGVSTGPALTPQANNAPTPDYEPHPFKVTRVGTTGNNFRVEAGTYAGRTIAAQTVDIGSSRPYAIHIKPQYDVTVFDGIFVTRAELKTGDDGGDPPVSFEPVLTGDSSSTLSDIDTLTSAGDELRCLIAIVESDNTITQVATGNVTVEIFDNLGGTGTASAIFHRNE